MIGIELIENIIKKATILRQALLEPTFSKKKLKLLAAFSRDFRALSYGAVLLFGQYYQKPDKFVLIKETDPPQLGGRFPAKLFCDRRLGFGLYLRDFWENIERFVEDLAYHCIPITGVEPINYGTSRMISRKLARIMRGEAIQLHFDKDDREIVIQEIRKIKLDNYRLRILVGLSYLYIFFSHNFPSNIKVLPINSTKTR